MDGLLTGRGDVEGHALAWVRESGYSDLSTQDMATELHFDCGTLVAPTLPDDGALRGLFQRCLLYTSDAADE